MLLPFVSSRTLSLSLEDGGRGRVGLREVVERWVREGDVDDVEVDEVEDGRGREAERVGDSTGTYRRSPFCSRLSKLTLLHSRSFSCVSAFLFLGPVVVAKSPPATKSVMSTSILSDPFWDEKNCGWCGSCCVEPAVVLGRKEDVVVLRFQPLLLRSKKRRGWGLVNAKVAAIIDTWSVRLQLRSARLRGRESILEHRVDAGERYLWTAPGNAFSSPRVELFQL